MATKKKTAVETATEPMFSKEALLNSKLFRDDRDLVSALLNDEEMYTISEVRTLVNEYLNRKVK